MTGRTSPESGNGDRVISVPGHNVLLPQTSRNSSSYEATTWAASKSVARLSRSRDELFAKLGVGQDAHNTFCQRFRICYRDEDSTSAVLKNLTWTGNAVCRYHRQSARHRLHQNHPKPFAQGRKREDGTARHVPVGITLETRKSNFFLQTFLD